MERLAVPTVTSVQVNDGRIRMSLGILDAEWKLRFETELKRNLEQGLVDFLAVLHLLIPFFQLGVGTSEPSLELV